MGHLEAVAADKTSLGFEFQDLVFIEKLLALKPNETLGLEVLDDIHLETISGQYLLFQVKHSLSGSNITDRDCDLWKTLANWLQVLPELPSHAEVGFRLHTNKGLSNQTFVGLLKAGKKNIPAIIEHIRTTQQKVAAKDAKKASGAAANPIAKHVNILAAADEDKLRYLFERFEFHVDNSQVLARIDDMLVYLSVPPASIDDTRKYLIGAFKNYKFEAIRAGKKMDVSFDDFRIGMGFARILKSARADEVNFEEFVDRHYNYRRTQDLSFANSKFWEQLVDLGVGREEIIDRGIEMVVADDFIDELRDRGLFGREDNLRLENNGHSIWKELHRDAHDTEHADDEAHRISAHTCYKQTLKETLIANKMTLPIGMSRGKFIGLSNQPRIGWKKDWEGKFKK